jgi:hypothetical protein
VLAVFGTASGNRVRVQCRALRLDGAQRHLRKTEVRVKMSRPRRCDRQRRWKNSVT